MTSGEGETVEFAGDCVCDGPVETWLQNVVDAMKVRMRSDMIKSGVGLYNITVCCVC